jgi:hypothetical protein
MDDAVAIDVLHQFAYCPRRAYLMHSEGLMAHNAYTEDGKRVHRRVDRVDHVLDSASTGRAANDDGEDAPVISRSVSLSCPRQYPSRRSVAAYPTIPSAAGSPNACS